jgi:diaminopimelate decarboxylase
VKSWTQRADEAVSTVGTPCYVSAWAPVQDALSRLDHLSSSIPVRSWLSFKTHPLEALAEEWLQSGRGVEVVSEREWCVVRGLGADVDHVLVNGVGKTEWLPRISQRRMRVHFDSPREVETLLQHAIDDEWRVGVRVQAPDECDRTDAHFRGQFGCSSREAVAAMLTLRNAGADLESVHFHLGQRRQGAGAYVRAIEHVATVCEQAGVAPRFLDCGGALPAASDPASAAALDDLHAALQRAAERMPWVEEIWLENGRFITEASAALAVRVVDIKERDECRYLICDGGRTNHALAADARPHPLIVIPRREGFQRLTTICGPTCMTDDRLGRRPLPVSVDVGDVIVWLEAGAYHLPWETRFSHGLNAIVWFDGQERPVVARAREPMPQADARWTVQ